MKAILHAGMPKTGSSSIQETLWKLDMPNHTYLDWRGPGHNPMVTLLFEDEPWNKPYFARLSEEEGIALRDEWTEKTIAQMQDTSVGNVIFSAERLFNIGAPIKQRVYDFFAKYCDEIEVIAYVRPPVSFLQSAFQQHVKTGTNNLNLNDIWPQYQAKYGAFDDIFGRENVTLKPFKAANFRERNVVLDFADHIGVDLSADQIIQSNESLSLEALSFMFLLRRFGGEFTMADPVAWRKTQEMLDTLSKVGGHKVLFAPELVNPVLERFADDIAWIEDRLGESILDKPKTEGPLITSAQDLIQNAVENQDLLYEALAAHLSKKPTERARVLASRIVAMQDL